jgi:hypothetical protein
MAWVTVLYDWNNGAAFSTISASFADVPPTELQFDLSGIENIEQLRNSFIRWYATEFQPAFEATNLGGSQFNTEDIPSTVLGATMASYFSPTTGAAINKLFIQMNNMLARDGAKQSTTQFGRYWTNLYKITVWQLGGGEGSNTDKYGPRNHSWHLMTSSGVQLPYYPSSSEGRFGLDILNTDLTQP